MCIINNKIPLVVANKDLHIQIYVCTQTLRIPYEILFYLLNKIILTKDVFAAFLLLIFSTAIRYAVFVNWNLLKKFSVIL